MLLFPAGLLLLLAAPAPGLSDRYLEVLQRYRRGETAAAYSAAQGWTMDALQEEVQALARLEHVADGCGACPEKETLRETPVRAAAMLHTDLWLKGAEGPTGRAHEALARAFLDLLPPAGDRDRFVQRWFITAAAWTQQGNRWSEALTIAEQGVKRFPASPQMAMLAGSIAESIGSPATAEADARDYLALALRHFQEARRLKPDLVEADLRAGRVAWRLGMKDEARKRLAAAIAPNAEDQDVLFLAHVFLGRVLEDGRDVDGAMREYRAASGIRPRNYVAHLALSQVLLSTGDPRGAREEFLAAAEDDLDDPYWEYPWGYSGQAEDWLSALRKEAAG